MGFGVMVPIVVGGGGSRFGFGVGGWEKLRETETKIEELVLVWWCQL